MPLPAAMPRKLTDGGVPRCAKGRNRYRDSPLRGVPCCVVTAESIDSGEAEPSIGVAAAKCSSTVEHELQCFGRSQRSPASTFSELMRNAVLEETRMPGRASRRLRSELTSSIGHDAAHNFLLKRGCCRFAQVIGITSDPKITFPYLLKNCASSLGL